MKPNGEMNERKLVQLCEIFWPDFEWSGQHRFDYDPGNRRKYYKVDCCSPVRKTVWEYEGPEHYQNVWKLKRDKERKEWFTGQSWTFLRWPYFCQLTRDVARHFFGDDYSEEKYSEAILLVYGVTEERGILAPGFHSTRHTPANFVSRGSDRFLEELEKLPASFKHQVVHSLNLYLDEVEDPYLVIHESEAFRELLQLQPAPAYLDLHYSRQG
jgi:hypothetical protein